jgi:hypothetical protein
MSVSLYLSLTLFASYFGISFSHNLIVLLFNSFIIDLLSIVSLKSMTGLAVNSKHHFLYNRLLWIWQWLQWLNFALEWKIKTYWFQTKIDYLSVLYWFWNVFKLNFYFQIWFADDFKTHNHIDCMLDKLGFVYFIDLSKY